MANMSYGVNILPKTNNTYTLGNSDYKWQGYFTTINGSTAASVLLPAVSGSDNGKVLKVASGDWSVESE